VFKDYYKTLNLRYSSGFAEISRSYESFKSQYHPDSCQSKVAKLQMLDIIEAHSILTDSYYKPKYDKIYKRFVESNISIEDFTFNDFALSTELIRVRKIANQTIVGLAIKQGIKETKEMTTGAIFAAKEDIRSGLKMYFIWLIIIGIVFFIVLMANR
jgi:DnaJ-class molecular chaperone